MDLSMPTWSRQSSTNSPATFITSSTAYQAAPPAGHIRSSVFVSDIDTTAGSLVYSTYVAGSTLDQGFAIALGPSNVAYVTGTANSTDFPVVPNPGAFDTTGATSGKAFVTLVAVDGTKSGAASVPYSTISEERAETMATPSRRIHLEVPMLQGRRLHLTFP